MDPNTALDTLRALFFRDPYGVDTDAAATLQEAAEVFEGLDHWLKSGGFLPADWQPGRKSA